MKRPSLRIFFVLPIYWAWVNDGGEAGIGLDGKREGRGNLHPPLVPLTRILFSLGSGIGRVPRTIGWPMASMDRACWGVFKCRLPPDLSLCSSLSTSYLNRERHLWCGFSIIAPNLDFQKLGRCDWKYNARNRRHAAYSSTLLHLSNEKAVAGILKPRSGRSCKDK